MYFDAQIVYDSSTGLNWRCMHWWIIGESLHDNWRDWNVSVQSLSYKCMLMLTGHVDNCGDYNIQFEAV